MQALLELATRKDAGYPPTASAWDGHGSEAVGRATNVQDTPMNDNSNSSGEGGECFPGPCRPETLPERKPPSLDDLKGFPAGAHELERARLLDLQADCSHARELRAIVTDFKFKGCGLQEGYLAELLVQVREKRPVLAVDP